MRPPSYYTSLANSNSGRSSAGSSSPSITSSHWQLRSSLSSPSSSSYAARTHLPYVSQSMLVAHCITGAGSSTKPYGQTSSRSSSTSNYSSSAGYSSSGYSRPNSIRYSHTSPYLSPSITSSSGSSSTSASNYTSSSAFSHRQRTPAASTSSYYQPIRLRERPLLTQISRQLNSTSGTGRSLRISTQRSAPEQPQRPGANREDASAKEPAAAERTKEAAEVSWSSDVARNISRNKYLIKFREFDRRPSASPDQLAAKEEEAEPIGVAGTHSHREEQEHQGDKQVGKISLEPHREPEKLLEDKMRLPVQPVVEPAALEVKQVDCDKAAEKQQVSAIEEATAAANAVASKKKQRAPKEKRANIKLKIKPLNANSSAEHTQQQPEPLMRQQSDEISARTDKESSGKEKENTSVAKKDSSSEQVAKTTNDSGPGSPSKVKVKKLVRKGSKANATETAADERSKETLVKKETTNGSSGAPEPAKEREVLAPKISIGNEKLAPKKETPATSVHSEKPVKTKTNQLAKSAGTTPPGTGAQAEKRIRFRAYNFEDFNFLTVLGHGGWGFVILAELKEHDACFAVKCIKKITIVEDDDFESIMIERKMLTLGNVHPFICKLFCTFETDGYLFFVMEYCPGGDLMFHVQREGKFTEPRCRFYAAEIICAIRFLHNRHIIYRDLKLDNILLDAAGHIRLVDFGMCQCRTYREEMLPSNFCGTPEYISPEIIKGVPYNHSVDWWSFGVLLYEMAVGKMPFRGSDENELLWNVCYEQIHYPMFLSRELTTLLQQLLEREPGKRMGMATCKAGDIQEQAWFRGVDWRATEEMRVEPPFKPEVNSKRDVQNFDADFTQSTPELSPVEASTLERIDQNQFQKFPYTNPNIFIFD